MNCEATRRPIASARMAMTALGHVFGVDDAINEIETGA